MELSLGKWDTVMHLEKTTMTIYFALYSVLQKTMWGKREITRMRKMQEIHSKKITDLSLL